MQGVRGVRGVRQVKPGRWEVTLSHKSLPNGRVFRTFNDEEQAKAYKVLMQLQLSRGVVPHELLAIGRRTNPMPPMKPRKEPVQAPVAVVRTTAPTTPLADVLRRYLASDNARIAKSDRPMVEYLQKAVSGSVEGVTNLWADNWVRSMKKTERLAPGTIRKRVECLARAIDWWARSEDRLVADSLNPLRTLPKGYSSYRAGEVAGEIPRDVERNRRLAPGEYDKIVDVLQGHKRPDRERPWADGGDAEMLMLFRLIVATGLRLREAYTLRVENIHFHLRTIHVRRSKTGAKRDVPMTREVEAWLRGHIGERAGAASVFDCWLGAEEEPVLRAISARLAEGR